MGLLLAPGPFNLFGEVFWPSGRSTSPVAFFHVLGAALVLAFTLEHAAIAGHRPWIVLDAAMPYAVALFIGLSIANHLTLYAERLKQSRQDWAMAQSILTEMRQKGMAVRDGQEVAVVATWRNAAQLNRVAFMDYGLSAFSTSWSGVQMLRMVSGAQLRDARAPASVCQDFRAPVEVRRYDDVFLACME
jgi:hypothetical protein